MSAAIIWLDPLTGANAFGVDDASAGEGDAGWAWSGGMVAVGITATVACSPDGEVVGWGPPGAVDHWIRQRSSPRHDPTRQSTSANHGPLLMRNRQRPH